MECPICNSKRVNVNHRKSREGFELKLVECKNCGHYAQPDDQYEDIYSTGGFSSVARNAEKIPKKAKIQALDNTSHLRFKYYSEIFKEMDDILEVGSSIGSLVHVLKLSGKNIEGLEPDPNYAAFSEYQYGFKQYASLLEDFEPMKSYKGIISFHVLEHVREPHIFLQKCKEILEPDGKVLFEFPSLDLFSYGSMRNTIWKPHIHYFTLASAYYLFSQYFEIKKIGFNGAAIFVYGVSSSKATYTVNQFRKYFIKGRAISKLVKYFPDLPGKYKSITSKQLLLQALFFQHDRKKQLQRFIEFVLFFPKSRLFQFRERKGSGAPATHVTHYHLGGNAGDTILSACVRTVIDGVHLNTNWNLVKVSKKVEPETIEKINRTNFLVIGGGGLLLPDTNTNTVSGWQWAISNELLEEIKVPLIVYAIGYNFFKGQQPNDIFINNVKNLIRKSDFFGLRNKGSISSINDLTGGEFEDKILYQPCPTTVIRKLYPKLSQKKKTKHVAVNIPYDRYRSRYGRHMYLILDQIALALKKIEEKGYKIFNVCHVASDELFEITLDKHQIKYKSVNLRFELPQSVYNFYNKMELVMAGRGHAQMIPFGVNARIISLGSHDKMRWFLEDIDALDWYINVRHHPESLCDRIIQAFFEIIESKEVVDRLSEKQDWLFSITKENQRTIRDIITF